MTDEEYKQWSPIIESASALKQGVHRIEGYNQEFDWKTYKVSDGIIRIDIKPKESSSGNRI